MNEIAKISEISSLNDFLDYKFSVKTLLIIGIIGAFFGSIFVVVIMGGVKNTQDYIKKTLYDIKEYSRFSNKNKNGDIASTSDNDNHEE